MAFFQVSRGALLTAAMVGIASTASAQVVINEVSFDRDVNDNNLPSSEPAGEFVELYNTGASAVDISGWIIDSRDPFALAPAFYTLPAGSVIQPGGYFVLGDNTVPNVDHLLPVPRPLTGLATQDQGYFEDRNETFELYDASNTLVDALFVEANKGGLASPADVIAEIGGGWYGNQSYIDGTGGVGMSMSRWRDGVDTNVNGRDWGSIRQTPGTSNNLALVATHGVPDADVVAAGTDFNAFYEPSEVGAVAVDPVAAGIGASPHGGNVISLTNAGGSFVAANEENTAFEVDVYFDPSLAPSGKSESLVFGIGTADVFFNRPGVQGGFTDTTANGSTGLLWLLERADNRSDVFLVDAGAGGDNQSWDVLASYRVNDTDVENIEKDIAAGWFKLGIDLGAGTAQFGDEMIDLSTTSAETDYLGGFFVGFNEAGAGGALTGAYWDISAAVLEELIGDYNDSGQVEQGDLDLVLQNWGVETDVAGVPAGWVNDLPDGQIEQTELDGVLSNWGDTAAPDFGGVVVPEPASFALMGVAGLAMLRRRA